MTFYQSGKVFSKILSITYSYIKRHLLLFTANQYAFIFIHREATPIGPPVVEWVLAKILRKKIIYDFDDAIWLTDLTQESFVTFGFRWRSKVSSICRWSYKISCGNNYLAAYAKQFNPNILIVPTTIDTIDTHLPARTKSDSKKKNITIGWTGSHSTLKYLEALAPVLKSVEEKFPDVRFLVIADKLPNISLKNLDFKPWKKETEISDLLAIDIGISPLPDDGWTRGKCGFKVLQYMSLEIPALVSPVAVNKQIIEHGIEGYWCSNHADWLTYLEELIRNADQRLEMGKRGREKVIRHYSVSSNAANFLSLFQ